MSTDPLKNIRIVLCETSHPGNIGAAARALKTMGLAQLYLVNPQRYPDPEAVWRASRAVDVLQNAVVCASLDDALHGCADAIACSARIREMAVPSIGVRDAAARLCLAAPAQPVALVFGNETNGLTTEQVNRCRALATIPANPDYTSLNLAAAVQVFTYELRMAALAEGAPSQSGSAAPHEQLESFYAYLEETLADIGFLDPRQPRKLMPRLRRLFSRAALEEEEINILRGMLKGLRKPRPPAP